MAKDTLKQIAEYKTRLAALEKKLHGELAKLPARYGFKTAGEFLAAFQVATGAKASGAAAPKAAAAAKGDKARKARVAITPAIIAKVKELVNGGKTGAEIAKAVGVSLPSVQNIKTKLGLVKKRG